MNILIRTCITTSFICLLLSACTHDTHIEKTSPLIGTFNLTVEDEYAAELNLRSDGVFTYARVGKNVNDRAYGQWDFTEDYVYLSAVKHFPKSWGSSNFILARNKLNLVAKIDNTDVTFEQTANYNDILSTNEKIRKRLENR